MDYEPWWNVLITIRGGGYNKAKNVLKNYGKLETSHYYNILKLKVVDLNDFLSDFASQYSSKPFIEDCISRIHPLMETFHFDSKEDFELKVKLFLKKYLSKLNGKMFQVRINRRGQKGMLHSLHEEQYLDHYIINSLELQKGTARVNFDHPDYLIDIETLDNNAGISIWNKDDLVNYPFLHP